MFLENIGASSRPISITFDSHLLMYERTGLAPDWTEKYLTLDRKMRLLTQNEKKRYNLIKFCFEMEGEEKWFQI